MARHSGKGGIVKHGANVFDGVTNWSIEETEGEADLTAAGDTWETSEGTFKAWTGSVDLKLDHAVAANQSLRVGDVVAFEFYSEGDASGKAYFSGSGRVTSHTATAPMSDAVTRSYSLKGVGELTVATVV